MNKNIFKTLIMIFVLLLFGANQVYADSSSETTYPVTIFTSNDGTPVSNIEVMISQLTTSSDYETITYGTSNNGAATFNLPNGSYVAVAGDTIGNISYYAIEDFEVDGDSVIKTLNLKSGFSITEAQSVYDRTTYFNHVDIRVKGTYTSIDPTTTEKVFHSVQLKDVKLVVTDNSTGTTNTIINTTFTDETENYEWRVTSSRNNEIQVPKTAVISLTFDLYLDGTKIKDNYTYSFKGEADYLQAIINCDQNQGLDFIINPTDLMKEVEQEPPQLYNVEYKWFIENTNTPLPTSAATPPVESTQYLLDSEYTIDTHWTNGTIATHRDGNTITTYKFLGWKEWSNALDNHEEKTELDDNTIVTIKEDTIIYGYWTVVDVEEVPVGNLIITKKFEGNEGKIPENFHFKITDPKGFVALVYYSSLKWNEELQAYVYELPIYIDTDYEYTTWDYIIEEHSYNLTGFNRTGGSELTQTVTISENYTGDTTVNFTNVYTKIKEIHSSRIHVEKADSKNYSALAGATFILTDLQGNTIGTPLVTNESGYVMFHSFGPGTYIIKEIIAPEGYILNENEHYKVEVTLDEANTQTNIYSAIHGGYVTIYAYQISVKKIITENGNEAIYDAYYNAAQSRLTVFNEKITGSITISKEFGDNSAFNKDNLPTNTEIKVSITGDNGYENTITLNKDNNWTVTLNDLELGIYTIEELTNYSNVPGYSLTIDYNNNEEITLSKTNLEGNTTITNTYTKIINYIDISVEKVWEVKDNFETPNNIEVGLYKDGELYDTQILSKDNNWTYTWTNLNDEYNWTVDEIKVPTGYTKTILEKDNHYIITNKYNEETNNNNDNQNNNNNNEIPKTSDSSSTYLYTIITLIGLIGLTINLKKYKKSNI